MGTGEFAVSRRGVLRGAALIGATGAGLATAVHTAPRAQAAPERPDIIPCPDWGAAPPEGEFPVRPTPQWIVIHHTGGEGDNSDDMSLERAQAFAQDIQSLHMSQGWGDTGQHFTTTRGGFVLEGRHQTIPTVDAGDMVEGVHCMGKNEIALGIENEGYWMLEGQGPTEAQWNVMVSLCAWLCSHYQLGVDVIGAHRDLREPPDTACPGDSFYPRMQELRDAVQAAMG